MLLALVCGSALLHAQPAPEPAPAAPTAPLAAPEPAPAPPIAAPAPPAPPAPAGGLTPEHLRALREYQARSIQVKAETEIRGGGASVVGLGYPLPYGYAHYDVLQEPIYTERTWGIYRGPERLNTPTFLGLVGETQRRDEVVQQLHDYRRNSRIWGGVAGAGLAAVLTGFAGMAGAESRSEWVTWNQVSLGGTVVTGVGLIGASFPTGKSARLSRDPSSLMEVQEARRLADLHNERLRQELGLRPDEVWLMELGASGN